jgi:branched-chain amino acid aminotransferase
MKRFAYVNGRLVAREEAVVSVFDYGLLYGFGVFETMRAYGGNVFKLEEHLKRLEDGARTIGLPPITLNFPKAIRLLLAKNNLSDAYVRVTLTYGVGKARLALDGKNPTVVVFAEKLPEGIERKQRDGITAGISGITHYSKNPLAKVKSTSFLQAALRKREAKERKLDDVLVLNERKHLVEASTSNIFMVDDKGVLCTPKVTDGCLPGITRETVLDIAEEAGLKAVEKAITVQELFKAREVFLTNSVMEVVPVVKVGDISFRIGRITRRIRGVYRAMSRRL